MKWIAISGSWRKTNKGVEADVRRTVREIIDREDGIVTGGALNVDYFATDEALKADPTASYIKVLLPTTLEIYSTHYRRRVNEGVIKTEKAEALIKQLETLQRTNPSSLIQNTKNRKVDTDTYYERNSKVIEVAEELIAFQVNDSAGVQDTVNKAKAKGIPVKMFSYKIP